MTAGTEVRESLMSNENDAEWAWMVEFNRIGTEEGVKGFPTDPEMLIGSCWREDFEAGLTHVKR
jgi:hypothetical protein